MSRERLAVLLYGELAGWLERDDAGEDPTFRYETEYVRSSGVALSARLPLTTAAYDARRVAPYLKGLLPENADTRRRWGGQFGVEADDSFGLLARMGRDCPGAVQFCPPSELTALHDRSTEYVALTEADIAERLRRLKDRPADWTMPEERWSLAGQQEKFALARIDGAWFQARGSAATTHIVKPGIPWLAQQAFTEHATMAAAAALAVEVAPTEYVAFEDQWAIVVRRFDRMMHEGPILRLHQEDFCQATGRLPGSKYESRGGPTLGDLASVVQRQSTRLVDDRRALADFLAINVVAGAPDGHSKNISMLHAPGDRLVAPLYDLATGLVYDRTGFDWTVALSVDGERRLDRITDREWVQAAGTLSLPSGDLVSRVAQLCSGFPTAFDDELGRFEVVPGIDELRSRSGPVVRAHCDRILARL